MTNAMLKNKVRELTLLGFNTYYKATVIKTALVLGKERIHRSMKQNKMPINRSTPEYVADLCQRSKGNSVEKGQSF